MDINSNMMRRVRVSSHALLVVALLLLCVIHHGAAFQQPRPVRTGGKLQGASKPLPISKQYALFSTSTNNDESSSDSPLPKPSNTLLQSGYRATAIIYTVVATKGLMASGITPASCFTITGPLLAACMAYRLSKATPHQQLASLPNQRMSTALGLFGTIGVVMAWLVRQWNRPFWYLWLQVSVLASVCGWNGLAGKSVHSGDEKQSTTEILFNNLGNQVTTAGKTLLGSFPSNLQSLIYRLATWLSGSLLVHAIITLFQAGQQGLPTPYVALALSQLGRMLLTTTTCLTLHEAADRGNLHGIANIQRNALLAYSWAAMSVYFSTSGVRRPLVVLTGVLSTFSALFAGIGILVRRQKIRYHDQTLDQPFSEKLSDDFPGVEE